MIERTTRFGRLVFDRDAIVRAALRAYIEATFGSYPFKGLSFPACDGVIWKGDLQRGAFYNCHDCDYDVVAWTEEGVVGLAYELGWGPIEQLDLSIDAVTGGPDDVRGALPGLPAELEPVLVIATRLLEQGPEHGEKCAGVGFWLHGDHIAGTFFDDPTAPGAKRLAMWGLLWGGRLWPRNSYFCGPDERASVMEYARKEAPIHALIDAVTDRALKGPTEVTPAEMETLFPTPPDPERVFEAQRMLKKVGVTWPGSPEIPEPPPRVKRPEPPYVKTETRLVENWHYGDIAFNRDTIVRVALRTYVEAVFVGADPLRRYTFPPCVEPRWTGDIRRGAFYNGDGHGAYDVVAWNEAGLVCLGYEPGFGPIEELGLSASAVTHGPDDVRGALTLLPPELEPAFVMAAGMLEEGSVHGEKLASIGLWLHGNQIGGSFVNKRSSIGYRRLVAWGLLRESRLPVVGAGHIMIALQAAKRARMVEPPLRAIVDKVAFRASKGPTELTTDELATLLPTPPAPERLLAAQRMLQKVGITWPGSPELPPETPRPPGPNPFLPRP